MINESIKCPECSHVFDVEQAIAGKLEKHLKKEYEQKFREQMARVNAEKEKLEKEKQDHDELLKIQLQKRIEVEKEKIRKDAFESLNEKLNALEDENQKSKLENKSLREKEVHLLRKEAALREEKEELALRIEKELLEKQTAIEEKAKKKERERFELEKLELLKQIEDNKRLAEEMKRRAEQGSMQLQGEVQELALEELLKTTYPFDEISEIAKGQNGADCTQVVFNNQQQECGKIVYESKRTKNFSKAWLDKLKQDQIRAKADIAVLVTKTMPNGMEHFEQIDGIWICGFHEVERLTRVLREILLKTQTIKVTQENRGDKKELLYTFFTSNEFVQKVKRIIENYDAMRASLVKEKKAMTKIWAERESQIWTVQENIGALFGSIKGIVGNELEENNLLDLVE